MPLRFFIFLIILFAPVAVFAQDLYPINLLKNQNWIITVTAEKNTLLDKQDFFAIGRKGEVFVIKAYEIDLKTGVKTEAVADYEVDYIKKYTEPKDDYLELRYCWYKYAPIRVGFTCHYFRIPVEIKQEDVKGDENFSSLMTSASDDFKVAILEKDTGESECNFKGKTHEGQKIYYTSKSDQFEKLGTFACFSAEQDAKQAGYNFNFAEGGEVINTNSETTTKESKSTENSSITNTVLGFPDVLSSHANYKAINFLQSRGIINGYDNGNFGPDDPITRVQALKILLLGSKINPENGLVSIFPDVSSYHWGQRFIAEANQRGIVNGNSDGTFRPDTTLNLAEALKMLLKTNNISPENPAGPPFMDVNVSDWFAPFAAYAKEKNLIDSKDYLNPKKNITRGELAELMYRLIYIQENKLESF